MTSFWSRALPPVEIPHGFIERVLAAIHAARLRRTRAALASASAGVAACLIVAARFWSLFASELMASDFFAYARLVWSDPDIMFGSARETAYAFLESVPSASLLLLLGGLFAVCVAAACIPLLRELKRATRTGSLNLTT